MKRFRATAMVLGSVLLIGGVSYAVAPARYAILTIDTMSALLSGTDWDSGYFKGTCADGSTSDQNPYAVWQFSWNPNGSIHSVTCVGRPSSDGSDTFPGTGFFAPDVTRATTTLVNDSADHRNGFIAMDWDQMYAKDECPASSTVNFTQSAMIGISQSTTTGALHAIRCAPVFTATFENDTNCHAVAVDNIGYSSAGDASNSAPLDFAYGFHKTSCGTKEYVVGISHDANGIAHKVLCCRSPS